MKLDKGKGKEKAIDDNDDDDKGNPSKGSVIDTMGSFITVLDTFKNIAPIFDAVLVDTDGSGQVHTLPFLNSSLRTENLHRSRL